ncbi:MULTISPECIES: nuclear transport factor 2 family protein [unclassified Bradyrhizobium]|uniref:nuclear transport factor 2 family protein n=1 Tax=unclassified Bradyrhizobium TaxID=2631580 RepID=UPI001FFBFA05|nr:MULTISPECIES: nuclear transport factor 2 family protein [unclassified Bradyrhizobium]MCK1344504.1 nuclear transport factor 2 family protein [Bradyrhizobium sp. CW11]MCK1591086.1 nuclear transport factor 2 family protein [Bradyrhizobium sp. 169]
MPVVDLSETRLQQMLIQYQAMFARLDVEVIIKDFAEHVRVKYGSYEPFVGKDKLRSMLQKRFSTMRDYRLIKKLEFVKPPSFAASWTGSWIDVPTGTPMELFGLEVLTVRDGLFSEWSASVSVWKSGETMTA